MQNEQEFLYKGPNHAANLNDMRLKDKYCDVTIKVDGMEIRAHKVILAANLNYFETMFSSDSFKESHGGVVTMKSVKKAGLELFVSYAYTGEILLTDNNALNLLELANYLGEDGIKEACVEFLNKHLKAQEASRAYKFADSIDCPLLKNAAKAKILTNFEECSKSADYLNFDSEMLTEILSDEKAHSIQLKTMLFKGILKWIMHDAENRKIYLEDLLNSINITKLKVDDLINCLYENVICYNDENGITQDTIKYYKTKQIEREERANILMTMNSDASYQFYNFIDEKWTPPLKLPASSNGFVYWSGAVSNDKLYYVGQGISGETHLRVFDPSSKQSTNLYPMSRIRGQLYGNLCACNRFLYICGEMKADTLSSDQVLRYDLQTNSFETLASMGTKREDAAVIFYQGYIYVIGGHDGSSRLQSVERYDPVRNEWTAVASMFEKRSGHAVAELNGKLYACGGYSDTRRESSVEVYDPTTNRWQLVASMDKTRGYFVVVVHKDRLLAIGGRGEGEKTVEVYDPIKDQWQMDDVMSAGLQKGCCVGGFFPSSCITNTQ